MYHIDVPWQMHVWLACCLVVLVLFVFKRAEQRRRGAAEPPGPWGLPIVGYMPFLGRKMNVTINKLAKKFGHIFQLRIGSRSIVVISGQKSIRAALVDKSTAFAGRPDFYTFTITKSFGFADFSPFYRVYKKHTLRALRQFTKVRREELQQVAHNAAKMLIMEFKGAGNQPVNPGPIVMKAVCTIIGYICYGEFFDGDGEEVKNILAQNEFFNYVVYGVICDFLPWTKFFFSKQLKKFEELLKQMNEYSNKLALAHIQSYDGETMRDMTDMFRKLVEDMDEDERNILKINNDMLTSHVSSMFGAGFGTTSTTLNYSMMIMALHLPIQERVQDEIDSVVGQNRYPEFDDFDGGSLPYTIATITEIFRYHSMSALGVTHSTTCDTEIGGYFIPKKTPVIINYFSANYDESIFDNPEQFDPSRFLSDDGTINKSLASQVVAFGLGQRRCSGEPVARLEILLFFATILQQCTIEQAPGCPLDLDNYFMGLGISHRPFKLVFRSRNGDW